MNRPSTEELQGSANTLHDTTVMGPCQLYIRPKPQEVQHQVWPPCQHKFISCKESPILVGMLVTRKAVYGGRRNMETPCTFPHFYCEAKTALRK